MSEVANNADEVTVTGAEILDEVIILAQNLEEFLKCLHFREAINSRGVQVRFKNLAEQVGMWRHVRYGDYLDSSSSYRTLLNEMYFTALLSDTPEMIRETLKHDCSIRRDCRQEYIERHFATNEPKIQEWVVLEFQYKQLLSYAEKAEPEISVMLKQRLNHHFTGSGSLRN